MMDILGHNNNLILNQGASVWYFEILWLVIRSVQYIFWQIIGSVILKSTNPKW